MYGDSKSKRKKKSDTSLGLFDKRLPPKYFRFPDRKTTEPNYFVHALKLIRVNWYPHSPDQGRINNLLLDSLQNKMLGMNSISKYLFTTASRRDVIISPRQYRRITDYKQLSIAERTQAYKFWRRVKIYANRRNIPYSKRIYGGKKHTEIDVLNYRINSVGNRLKKQTLKILGKGDNFFADTKTIHTSIPTLDVAETVRPLLYFVVLRSLSLPMRSVLPVVDRIISDGMRWVTNRIELICDQNVVKYRINFHDYCNRITDEINQLEIQELGLHTKHKVTESREPGIIRFITPTKETKAGERIHRKLLSEFSQPLSLDKNKILNSNYLHALAEVKLSNIMGTIEGRVDLMIINNKLEVLLIADIKTHEQDNIELYESHKFQVNSYLSILKENGYIIDNTIRSIIHIHRDKVPVSIKPVLDWMITNREVILNELGSEDLKCKIDYDTLISMKPGEDRSSRRPTMKKDSLVIHPPRSDAARNNVILSLWS